MARRIFGVALAFFGRIDTIWWSFGCVEFLMDWRAFPAWFTVFLACLAVTAAGTSIAMLDKT